jgi:hypothetical protein
MSDGIMELNADVEGTEVLKKMETTRNWEFRNPKQGYTKSKRGRGCLKSRLLFPSSMPSTSTPYMLPEVLSGARIHTPGGAGQ